MNINLSALEPIQRYDLLSATIIPRPIAWVLSDNGDTSYNLAPFSYFNAVCSDPPLIMLSIGWKDPETKKDTRVNIEERNEFVIHIAHTSLTEKLNASSATLPHGQSEVKQLELETIPFENFRLPRLKDPHIALACSKYELREIGPKKQSLLLGEVHHVFLEESLVTSQGDPIQIDAATLDPLARLGRGQFASLGKIIHLRRPK